MRRIMKKILVFALVLAMVASNSLTAFATENTNGNTEENVCTGLEDCAATEHEETCAFAIVEAQKAAAIGESEAAAASDDGSSTEAEVTVAKIGEKSYATLADAVAAANDMTDTAITIDIYGKTEYTDATGNLTGAYSTINFVGQTADAEISITRDGSGGYISGVDSTKTVNFTNLTLSKPTGTHADDAGFMNVYFTVYRVAEVNYTKCTFPDGACAQGGKATYTSCDFANQTSGEYSLWVYADVDCTVTNSEFTGVRGVKMYAEGAAKTSDLTLSGVKFTESITEKPAIVLTYGESVTLSNNTYPANGVFELDKDGAPNGTTVTADITDIACKSDDYDDCGVLVDGKIYTTITDAVVANAVTADSTVTLCYASEENVELPTGVTLNKNGYTADNVIVAGNEGPVEVAAYDELVAALANGGEIKLTADITIDTAIKVLDGTTIDMNGNTIYLNVENSYFGSVTIKNEVVDESGYYVSGFVLGKDDVHVCDGYFLVNEGETLTMSGLNVTSSEDGIKGYAVFHLKNGANLNLDDCVIDIANNEYSGSIFYANNTYSKITMEDVDVTGENVGRGFVNGDVTMTNSCVTLTGTIEDGLEHGFNGSNLVINDSDITISGGTGRGITLGRSGTTNMTVNGESTITITDMGEATIKLSNSTDTITVADTATVTVDKEISNANSGTVTGTITVETSQVSDAVAKIGDTVYYDLAQAMLDAKSGQTVVLVRDVDLAGTDWEPVSFKGTFDGNGFAIKNMTINKPGVANTGFVTSLNGTIKNVTFENPTVTGGECTGVVAGRAGGNASLAENIKVTGTIKVETTHSGYARAGVIVGGWAYGNYKDIVVDGGNADVSYIKHTGGGDGRYVAGIVGHADDVESYTNCTVKNITISGGWLCGGIAGPGPSDGLATECTVENINVNADYSGGMFGWYYGAGTIEDSSVKDVTFTDGSTNNGAIGGYSNNDAATLNNVTVDNVKNADGAPLLDHVAQITCGETYINYTSVEAALEEAQNGDVITILDREGSEEETEIDFTKSGTFTITGDAPDYKMPIITVANEDGTTVLNIENATLAMAEIDARQNATINVINSKITGVGSNDIVKSYYNGAINISGTSEVYTMQVTTMGYINVEDTAKLNATWQTNVYGNGMITVKEDAVFATAGLALTGKDYSNRDNTDTERVGKPATIIVDGATFNVGEVYSVNGADYSYNAGKYGINIGTIEDKSALLEIKNGAEVNFKQTESGYTYSGQITVGADGKVIVEKDSSVTTNCGLKVAGTLLSSGDISGAITATTSDAVIEISGGTYTQDVSKWCAEGFITVDNGDGTYSVGKMPRADVTVLKPMTLTAAEHGYVAWPSGDNSIDRPLDIVVNFKATESQEDAAASIFGKWAGDFYVTVTGIEDGTLTADDCYLAGNYGTYGWIVIPMDGTTITEGVANPVVSLYDANLTYENICDYVRDFTAAIHISDEIIEANPDLKIELALNLKNPATGDLMVIGEPAVYDVDDLRPEVATNEAAIGSTQYATLEEAIKVAEEGQNINILTDITIMPEVSINKNLTIVNANGYTLWDADVTTAITAIVADGYEVTNVMGLNMIFAITEKPEEVEPVAQIGDVTYSTVEAALRAAKSGDMVVMTADSDEAGNDLILNEGVTLNMGAYNLAVRSLVGANGSFVCGDAYHAQNDYAKLSAETLILGEEAPKVNGNNMIPVWNVSLNCYVFSLFNITDTGSYGLVIDDEKKVLTLSFTQQLTGIVRTELLADNGGSDNELNIMVKLSWSNDNGVYNQEYVYKDAHVKYVAANRDNGAYYTFTLTGYDSLMLDLDTLQVQAVAVTESGVVAAGQNFSGQ